MTPKPGIDERERAIRQRVCQTRWCAFEGQRWDEQSSNSAERCPECRQTGKLTGVRHHVADGEHQGGGRIVEVAGPTSPGGAR